MTIPGNPGSASIRVRIAPSPTGDPHVGTAYIGLLNFLYVRQRGGKFVLRIEDTDRARFVAGSEQMIFDSLRWLGLEWDEGPDIGGPFGPYRQSERTGIYRSHVEFLLKSGHAYRSFETAEELDAMRRSQIAAKLPPRYNGAHRELTPAQIAAFEAEGRPSVVRLKVPVEGETSFRDQLRGPITFSHSNVDDQVLLKSDGFPTYHLANVVDDHRMGITHVIRAEEWLSSTPKHVELYKAFGWLAPEWIHMPLLRNADKSKISKRKNPVSLDYYRAAGFLPEALLNYLGTMGWSIAGDREKFTLQEMIEAFTFDRISLGGPVFDLVKLSAVNADYLRALDDDGIVARLREWRLSDEFLRSLVPLVRKRIQRLDEFVPMTEFFFSGDVDHAPWLKELVPANRTAKDVSECLFGLIEALDVQRDFSAPALEAMARAFAEKSAWDVKELFMVMRLAATARKATPPLFETLSVLGRDMTRRRLRLCADLLKKAKA
jgi:glutamyl-tRNA synthetase